jgi:hypothetical protein
MQNGLIVAEGGNPPVDRKAEFVYVMKLTALVLLTYGLMIVMFKLR